MVVARGEVNSTSAAARWDVVLSPLPTFLISTVLLYVLLSCFEQFGNSVPLKLAFAAGAGLLLAGGTLLHDAPNSGNPRPTRGRDRSDCRTTDRQAALAFLVFIAVLLIVLAPGELPLWGWLMALGGGLTIGAWVVVADGLRWSVRLYRWTLQRSPCADVTGRRSD